MFITAISSVLLHLASFLCSSDELNITSTKSKNIVGYMTWNLLLATVCFHISFVYTGKKYKSSASCHQNRNKSQYICIISLWTFHIVCCPNFFRLVIMKIKMTEYDFWYQVL